MPLNQFYARCLEAVKTVGLANVTDPQGQSWLQIPGHTPHLIGAHKGSRDPFEIRLKPRPNAAFYEETTTLLVSHLISTLRPPTVFDIGCAGGYFCAVAASHEAVRPEVHGFDMAPSGIASLEAWIARAAFPGRVKAHLAGLSDQHVGNKTIWYVRSKLFEHEPSPAEYLEPWWLRAKFALQGNRSQRNKVRSADVLLTSLDHFCSEHDLEPGLIKLDVDGYEGKVLRGAKATLRAIQPVILMELHRDKLMRDGLTRYKVADTMFDAGYHALFVTDHHSRAQCDLVEVFRGDALFGRQQTDMVLFVPPRLAE